MRRFVVACAPSLCDSFVKPWLARIQQATRSSDCESVENCGFIAVLGSPMRQLCARFQVCARPSRSINFGRFPATNNLNCHRVDNS